MANVGKKTKNINGEMTPQWLEKKQHEQCNSKPLEHTEEERLAFLEKMNQNKEK